MQTTWAGKSLHYYQCVDSTNAVLKQLAKENSPHGELVVSDKQTAGRGRRGRSWESPEGCNIYFSLLLRPAFAVEKASMLTLVMACAVTRGIERALRESASAAEKGIEQALQDAACETATFLQPFRLFIKWPNDILLNSKKICGILTELCMDSNQRDSYCVIIGVGINVKAQDFPVELSDKASSIEQECGICLSRKQLTEEIMSAFEEYYELFAKQGDLSTIKDEYNAMLVNRDREVCVLDPKGEFQGVARGINDTGELLVELSDGSITEVYAGEVSVRGICGYV